jgi:hypothetical protein
MVLTVSFVLFPVTGLSCHRHRRKTFHQLDASVGASEPHDFAVRVSALVRSTHRVHRIPLPTSVTIASRPSLRERDGGGYEVIWVTREQEYFCDEVWTASIALFVRRYFLFKRDGIWLGE